MFNRWIEDGLLDVLREKGIGCIVFSPLAQGLLTDRYLPASRRIRAPAGPPAFYAPSRSPRSASPRRAS